MLSLFLILTFCLGETMRSVNERPYAEVRHVMDTGHLYLLSLSSALLVPHSHI